MPPLQRTGYIIVAILAFIFAYFLVKPYINVIFLAIAFALVLRPLYNRLHYEFHRASWLAVTITILAAVLLIIIPVFILLQNLYGELAKLLVNFNPQFNGTHLDLVINYINHVLEGLPVGNYQLTKQQIIAVFENGVQTIGWSVVNDVLGIGQGVIGLITNVFIFFFVLVATLPQQPKIKQLIEKISPLQPVDTQLYLSRAHAIIVDTIRGTLVIAVVQASLGIAFLFFTPTKNLTLLFFLMFLLSLLPVVGTALVTIPISIYFILSGDILTGVLLILWQLFVMSTVDNLLRPILVSEESNIMPVFMLLAILGGLRLFGPIGILYGPLIMVLFLSSIEIAQKRKLFR